MHKFTDVQHRVQTLKLEPLLEPRSKLSQGIRFIYREYYVPYNLLWALGGGSSTSKILYGRGPGARGMPKTSGSIQG